MLVVYDQVALPYCFDEVVEILGALPPRRTLHVLCSRAREEEARARLAASRLDARLLVCEGDLWGDWGRDIFQVGWRGGRTAIFVPYTKTATSLGQLTRGYRVLKTLAALGREVVLVPLAFEGGNLAYDLVEGERVLFAGNSVLVESSLLYQRYFGKRLAPAAVVDLLERSFGVDRVVPLGRTAGGVPLRQNPCLFHIDLACAILSEGLCAVQRFEVPGRVAALEEEIRREREVAAALDSLPGERRPKGAPAAAAPARPREPTLEEAVAAELERLREASEELAAIRRTFRSLGYRIVDLPNDWRRVRRVQSYANVLVGGGRLVMPIFPRPGAGIARAARAGGAGRQVVEIVRPPGPGDYRMEGTNRESYLVYRSLLPDVRVVRDTFYLAGGNVHCVVGSIA